MKNFNILVLCAVLFVFAGCYRVSYTLSPAKGKVQRDDQWNNFFILGLVPVPEERNINDMCRSEDLVEIKSYQKPVNVLVSLLGVGIVSSSTVQVTCSQLVGK